MKELNKKEKKKKAPRKSEGKETVLTREDFFNVLRKISQPRSPDEKPSGEGKSKTSG